MPGLKLWSDLPPNTRPRVTGTPSKGQIWQEPAKSSAPTPDASQDRACSLAHNLHIERPQIKGMSSKLETEHA